MIEIPDYLSAAYMIYRFDGYEFDFQALKFPEQYPMWQRAVFIHSPDNQFYVARYDDGHVYWGEKRPTALCRYYIEAIIAKERVRVHNSFCEKYRAKK